MAKFDWVTDFMKAVERDYDFYDKTTSEFRSISFHDEKEHTIEGEIRHYREVCFAKRKDVVQPINDEYVYYQYSDASRVIGYLARERMGTGFIILGFRHSENDWSIATTIEKDVVANKLGWGIFTRKVLLEGLNTDAPKKEDE
jgi:hypothetical protein